jgi:competence protein ComEA
MALFPFPAGRRRAVAAGVVGLLLVALLLRHVLAGAGGGAGALQVAPLAGDVASAGPAAPAGGGTRLVVDVVGAVRRPGVYRLRHGARVQDAVARAGGVTARADPVAVNLAAPLVDGEQVVVAVRGAVGGSASGPAPSAPVSLSTATAEQLDALPGIGPVTAQKIVDFRQQHGGFSSVDDLDAIPGFGPARLANLKGLVVP